MKKSKTVDASTGQGQPGGKKLNQSASFAGPAGGGSPSPGSESPYDDEIDLPEEHVSTRAPSVALSLPIDSLRFQDEILGSDEEEQEDPKDYRKGGYHPVNIGDVFNGRCVLPFFFVVLLRIAVALRLPPPLPQPLPPPPCHLYALDADYYA